MKAADHNRQDTLFRGYLLGSPKRYDIVLDDRDRETLLRWKKEVDGMIEDTKKKLAGQANDPDARNDVSAIRFALGDHPDDTDITLYAIGTLLVHKQHRDCNALRMNIYAALKFVLGGTHHVSDLETAYNTCIDVPATAKALADLYGIPGEICFNRSNPAQRWHYYWQERVHPGAKPRIIDTFYAENRNGFLRSPGEQQKRCRSFLRVERRKIREQLASYLPWNWKS